MFVVRSDADADRGGTRLKVFPLLLANVCNSLGGFIMLEWKKFTSENEIALII